MATEQAKLYAHSNKSNVRHKTRETIAINVAALGLVGINVLMAIGLIACKTAEQNFPGTITAEKCDVDTNVLYEGDFVSPDNKSNYAPFPGAILHNPIVHNVKNEPMYVAIWGDPFEKFFIKKSETTPLTLCVEIHGSFRNYINGKMEIELTDGQKIYTWVEPKRRK